MSAIQRNALDAIALQMVAALEQYDQDTARMIEAWPDLELYRMVSDGVETIRAYSGNVPEVRVQWVELLIAHAELVHFLWRTQYGDRGGTREQIGAVREHHAECIAALRSRGIWAAGRALQRQPAEVAPLTGALAAARRDPAGS
jgi:hypothetical protein